MGEAVPASGERHGAWCLSVRGSYPGWDGGRNAEHSSPHVCRAASAREKGDAMGRKGGRTRQVVHIAPPWLEIILQRMAEWTKYP
jgi:hypothetical protein